MNSSAVAPLAAGAQGPVPLPPEVAAELPGARRLAAIPLRGSSEGRQQFLVLDFGPSRWRSHRVERRVIETGVHDGGSVEVVRGLAAGDRVVTRGHTALVDGARVEVRNPDGTATREAAQ